MMKRNIIATIKFAPGKIGLTVLEKLSTNTVEIFNVSSDARKVHQFLQRELQNVEQIIGGKLIDVTVVVEPTAKTEAKIKLHKESIQVVGHTVSRQDIDNILQLTKNKIESENRKVILVHPVRFDVHDVLTKSYSRAPIHKKGNTLYATSAVTIISAETHDYINQVVKSQGLNISQMLLSPQAYSQANLTESALTSGSVLINVGMYQSFITINKNLSTIAALSIYDYGFQSLVAGVSKVFNCGKAEAENLIAVYGSLKSENINRIIYTDNSVVGQVRYAYELNAIIKSFADKLLFVAKKFVNQKNVGQSPVVFSGHLNKIDGFREFIVENMKSEYISLHTPLTFVEMNKQNVTTIGASHFMNRMDGVLGKQFNTIVETNPNAIASFLRKGKMERK